MLHLLCEGTLAENGQVEWRAEPRTELRRLTCQKPTLIKQKHVTLFCSSQILTRKSHNLIETWTVSIHLIKSALLPLDCWVTLIVNTLTATTTPADNSSSQIICWESSRAILTLCSAGGRHSNKIYFSLVWLRLSELSPAGLFLGLRGFHFLCWTVLIISVECVPSCARMLLRKCGIWWGFPSCTCAGRGGKWEICILLGLLSYSKNISCKEQTTCNCWVSPDSLALQTD